MLKKIKTKTKKLLIIKNQIRYFIYLIGFTVVVCSILIAVVNFYRFIQDPVGQDKLISTMSIQVPKVKAYEKDWAYNERVPREVSEAYIENSVTCKLVGVDLIKNIITCENTEWDNTLKTRLEGTAVGLAQYTIGTWYETDSWKLHKKARTDFKAMIDEMCDDILLGEIWRWSASEHCWSK